MNIISSSNNRKLPVVTLKQLSTTNSQQQQQQSTIDATINKIATSSSSSIMDDYDESRILKSLSDETKHQPQQQSIQNGCILDDSLTSLTWLQNLNLLKANNAKNTTINNNSTNSSVIASTAVNDSTINNKNMNSESTPTLVASKTSTTTCVTEFPVVMNDQTSTQSSNSSFALIGISYPPLSPPLSVQCSPNSTNSSSNHSTKTTTTLNTNMTAINTPNKFAKTAIGTTTKSNNSKSGYSRANSSGTTVKKIKQAVLSSSVSSKKNAGKEAISTNQSTTSSSPSAAFHSDSNAKPPYSYSQLIVLSMRESRASKMTLQMIYDWIIDNFGYFRKADPNWQVTFKNSIRHNLSLNKCFKKIARQKDEPGKGGFWTLDEEYKKQLLCNERSPTNSSVVVGESSAANESDAVATNTATSSTTTTTSTTKDGQLPSTMEAMQSLKRRRKSPKSENPRQPKSTIRKMDEQKSSGGSGTSKAKKLKTAALKHSMSVPDGKQSTPSSSEASTSSTLEANSSYLAPFSTNASNTNTNNISSLQLQQNSSWQQQQHTHQHHHNHQHHPSCHQSSFTCSCGGMNGGYSTYNSYYGQQQTSTPSYNRSMTCCTSMPSSSTNLYHSHHHHNAQNHHPHMVDDLSNTFSSSFGHEIIKSMDDDVEATAAGLFNFEQALECNFDLDPLTSSQAPVQSSVATHIPTTNDMSNHHHIHNNQHHSMPPSVHPLNRFQHQSTSQQQTVETHQNTTTTTDVELNELFEYTSQFSNTMSQQNGVSQNNGGDYLSYLSAPNAYDMLGGEANSQGGSTTSSSGAESPLDQVSKARLDLTIQGHGIKQPKWWMDSLITSGNNDPLNNSHSQSASSTTSFHFIDLDNNITGSDLLGMPSKRDAADECDSASMFINTASLCYDVGNQAAVTSSGDKELLSSSLAAAVDSKDII